MTSHWVDSVQKKQHDHEPLAWQCHVAKKATAYLKELKCHNDRGCTCCERCCLLRRKLDGLPLSQIGLEHLQAQQSTTHEHVRMAEDFTHAVGRAIRQKVLEWRAKMLRCVLGNKDESCEDASFIYKWLKHGAQSLPVIVEEGRMLSHPPQVLDAVHRYWNPILCPNDYAGISESTRQTAIEAIGACEFS
eukprot:2096424-Amphidinium_carterae.1